MKIPPLLIVVDYTGLVAYLVMPDEHPEIVSHVDFLHDAQTHVPLIQWEEGNKCYGELAGRIGGLLEPYHPDSWGLACPPPLCERLRAWLPPHHRATLAECRAMEVGGVTVTNVVETFGGQRELAEH